jgi:hypothetical protein
MKEYFAKELWNEGTIEMIGLNEALLIGAHNRSIMFLKKQFEKITEATIDYRKEYIDGTRVRVTFEFDVEDCRNCSFKKRELKDMKSWVECSHPKNNRSPYENILWMSNEHFKGVPEWCPLGLHNKLETKLKGEK